MTKLLKKYYDVSKLVIWGEGEVDGDNKRPRMVFGFRDGNPRFVVYTGLQGKEGVINFPCDAIHMTGTMHFLKDIIAGPAGEKFILDSLRAVYEDNKPTKEKQLTAALHAGKSKDGIIYFCLIAEGRPKIVFPIKQSPFHMFRDAAKNPIPDGVVSQNLAKGLIDMILHMVSDSMLAYTNEEYANGKKQGSTDTRGGEAAGQVAAANASSGGGNKNIIQDLDDLAL